MPEEVLEANIFEEDVCIIEWCKANINLTTEASPSLPGWISFEETPWIEEILRDWTRDNVTQYNILASTQVGKTIIQLCCVSFELDTNPGQMQFTIPTDDGVSDFVSGKIDPFVIESIASIQSKVIKRKEDEKKRLKGALKEVPGGKLFILGNTAINRRGKSVTRAFMDEVGLFKRGDVDELIGRVKFSETFITTKALIVSSIK